MNNKMEEVAKLLDLELGEPFNVECAGKISNPLRLTKLGLVDRDGRQLPEFLALIIKEPSRIQKEPWVPVWGQEYWSIGSNGRACSDLFNSVYDLSDFAIGNAFPTKEIAEANREVVLKKFVEIGEKVLGFKPLEWDDI